MSANDITSTTDATATSGCPRPPCSAGFRYWEAVIVSRDNRGTLMEWHDGQRERLKGGIDWPLHWIATGCTLGVWVKLGPGDRVIELWPEVEIISSPNEKLTDATGNGA